jgi:hypothetical protein
MAIRKLGFSLLLLAGSCALAQKPGAASGTTPEERFFTAIAGAPQAATPTAGSAGGTPFKEIFPDGGILVGFDIWQGPYSTIPSVIKAICPIYETAKGRQRGQVYGEKAGSPITVEAKPGDAVMALNVRSESVVDGLRVLFQKVDYFGFRLTAASSYKSDFVGGDGGTKRIFPITSNGKPVVGIHGAAAVCVDRIGFITADKK